MCGATTTKTDALCVPSNLNVTMNQQRPTFFYELCRLCLEAEGFYDIFETENLLQDIYACTGLIVFVSDKLPHKICTKCMKFIKSAIEFRVFVKKNDSHLRSVFTSFTEVDIIKTIACQTPKVMSESENVCEKVQSGYFENGGKDDANQKNTESKIHSDESFLEASPMVTQTISIRKDLFNSSPIPSYPDSPISTTMELKDDPHELLEEKVKMEHICEKMKEEEAIDYVCGICSKTFLTYKKFYLHQRLHNKTIVCPLHACGMKFATKGDLEKHVRTHTGEKPYVCEFCNRGFSQRVSLRYHVRTKHPQNPVESVSVLSKEQLT